MTNHGSIEYRKTGSPAQRGPGADMNLDPEGESFRMVTRSSENPARPGRAAPSRHPAIAVLLVFLVSACSTGQYGSRPLVDNAPGRPTQYVDPATTGVVAGVGIESQDIISMSEQMMRSLLTSGVLDRHTTPPRVIVDDAYFENEGTQFLNKRLIIDRLRTGLVQASQGRVMFVARERAGMVDKERALKRQGVVDSGTTGLTRAPAGADYRLAGRIKSLDARDRVTGVIQRYNQITFELVDLEYGTITWSDQFEFSKFAQEDAVYR